MKQGIVRRKTAAFTPMLGTYKNGFLSLDDGNLVFASEENDLYMQDPSKLESHSLLNLTRIAASSSNSSEFEIAVKLVPSATTPTSKPSSPPTKTFTIRTNSPQEATEWVETIRHELINQALVCKKLSKVLAVSFPARTTFFFFFSRPREIVTDACPIALPYRVVDPTTTPIITHRPKERAIAPRRYSNRLSICCAWRTTAQRTWPLPMREFSQHLACEIDFLLLYDICY